MLKVWNMERWTNGPIGWQAIHWMKFGSCVIGQNVMQVWLWLFIGQSVKVWDVKKVNQNGKYDQEALISSNSPCMGNCNVLPWMKWIDIVAYD
jgi:hypothetical protein